MSLRIRQSSNHENDFPGQAWYRVDLLRGCAVVRAGVEIEAPTVARFHEVLSEATALAPHVVLDLAQVTFVDSSGLGAMIVARKTARGHGGSLSLVSPPPVVRRLQASTLLHDAFAIHDSLAEAVNVHGPKPR